MTIDEAINYCELVADSDAYGKDQLQCNEKHYEIAKILKELKNPYDKLEAKLRHEIGYARHVAETSERNYDKAELTATYWTKYSVLTEVLDWLLKIKGGEK